MFGLKKALDNHKAACSNQAFDRDQLDEYSRGVMLAAERHISNSHISITSDAGGCRRLEVLWDAREQRFIDWGNNFWMYGPKSTHGNGRWKLGSRYDNEVIVAAILDRANHATKFDRVDRLWNFYWQLLLQDAMQNSEGLTFDLHINPLDVASLEPKPEPFRHEPVRERDIITV
jgi:hypothetical protein